MLGWTLIAAVFLFLVLLGVALQVLLDAAHRVWSDQGRGE